MIDLSVIIPMYNAELYIEEAVESILKQKDVSLEIIIINDGSTDNSINKLKKYHDIAIYSINNSGAGFARNYGIRLARGKYLMFLDADDYINDNTICSRAIKKIQDTQSQMCLFSFNYLNQKTREQSNGFNYPKEIQDNVSAQTIIPALIKNGCFPASPCYRIVEREFIVNNNIFFQEHTIAEDIEWTIHLLLNIQSVCIINQCTYIYRKSISDSVTGKNSLLKCSNLANIIDLSIQDIQSSNNTVRNRALYSALAYELSILMANAYNFSDKTIHKNIKRNHWLLKYDLFPGIRYIRFLYRLFGYRITSYLLFLYLRYKAKSNG